MIRILEAVEGLSRIQGKSLIFHPGYHMKDSKADTYKTIKENLARLPYRGIDYRLETTGKGTQFGTIEELWRSVKKYARVNYVSISLISTPEELVA